jgi:hypothetical protein
VLKEPEYRKGTISRRKERKRCGKCQVEIERKGYLNKELLANNSDKMHD